MRIHFVSHSVSRVSPPSEAVAIWTQQVAQRLAADHEVVVWGRRYPDEPSTLRQDGVEYRLVVGRGDYRADQVLGRVPWSRRPNRPIHLSFLYHPFYHLAVARGLRAAKPDVIHVHSHPQVARLAHLACPQALVVFHAHSQYFTFLDRRVVSRHLRRVDLALCCSDFVSSAGRAAFPDLADRFATVYNGVDTALFGSVRHVPAASATRLLFVGRISPEKGVHVLADAFADLAAQNPAIELVVVGKEGIPPRESLIDIDPEPRVLALEPLWRSGYRDGCLQRISANVRGRARFQDWHDHAQLPALFAGADIFVWPAVWDEPFGMPIVEAMAAGLPVVASRTGGIPEIVEDGRTGILVDPARPEALAEAIAELADEPTRRAEMGERGRERAARFAWDRIAHRVGDLYGEYAAARPGRAGRRGG